MRVRWTREAREETDAAAVFYFEKRPSLARRFIDEVEATLLRVQRHPEAYRRIDPHVRWCRVRHFPYGIVYRATVDGIEIIAIAHLRRSPGYWKGRN